MKLFFSEDRGTPSKDVVLRDILKRKKYSAEVRVKGINEVLNV